MHLDVLVGKSTGNKFEIGPEPSRSAASIPVGRDVFY
jgi:hypothetical protein